MEYVNLASGGSITRKDIDANSYWVIHTFTANGTFTKSTSKTLNGYYLIVAGGGGGGYGMGNASGGGGGAGGLLTNWEGTAVTLATSSVTIGSGGAGSNDQGNPQGKNGGNSAYNGMTAIGGGGGGKGSDDAGSPGSDGGSAGGPGSHQYLNLLDYGGYATSGQGNRGGRNSDWGAGGGGGAGGAGSAATGSTDGSGSEGNGGSGGPGRQLSINGEAKYYAAGGGGGSRAGYIAQGGSGIGGNGAGWSEGDVPTAAVANTGSGGGGGGGNSRYQAGAAGSAGIVIIAYQVTRYQVTKTATSNGTINGTTTQASQWVTSGESVSYSVVPNNNYRINQLTVNGTTQALSVSELNSGKSLSVTPTANTTVAATFTLKPHLTINKTGSGSITVDGSEQTSGYVDYSVARTFTITPAAGWVILSVTLAGVAQSVSNRLSYSRSITLTGNATLAVVFAPSGGAVYQHFM